MARHFEEIGDRQISLFTIDHKWNAELKIKLIRDKENPVSHREETG